jgi:hypothetical protein
MVRAKGDEIRHEQVGVEMTEEGMISLQIK